MTRVCSVCHVCLPFFCPSVTLSFANFTEIVQYMYSYFAFSSWRKLFKIFFKNTYKENSSLWHYLLTLTFPITMTSLLVFEYTLLSNKLSDLLSSDWYKLVRTRYFKTFLLSVYIVATLIKKYINETYNYFPDIARFFLVPTPSWVINKTHTIGLDFFLNTIDWRIVEMYL